MKFANKVVFITGAGQGIGESFAQNLASQGAAVMIADLNPAVGEAAAARIRDAGGKAAAVACNVADEKTVQTAVDATITQFGGIDILINNAAKHLTEYGQPVTKLSAEKWRDMLNVNVVGLINCTTACKASMGRRGGGVIINIASIAGFLSNTAYGISKLAVRGLTVAMAIELADQKTRVFGIAPGILDTPTTVADLKDRLDSLIGRQLIKRLCTLDDLNSALTFLCSDDSSFMTGETLVIGGGYPTRL